MLERWLNTVFNLQLHLTITDVLFGKYFDKTDYVCATVNYVILYAKWYMYRYKDRFFLDYLVDLRCNVVIEKYIDQLESENDDGICNWDMLLTEL